MYSQECTKLNFWCFQAKDCVEFKIKCFILRESLVESSNKSFQLIEGCMENTKKRSVKAELIMGNHVFTIRSHESIFYRLLPKDFFFILGRCLKGVKKPRNFPIPDKHCIKIVFTHFGLPKVLDGLHPLTVLRNPG